MHGYRTSKLYAGYVRQTSHGLVVEFIDPEGAIEIENVPTNKVKNLH